jgi:hypothetical protein
MNPEPPVNVFMLATYSYWVAVVVVHVALAVGVFRDAEDLLRTPGRRLWYLNSFFWTAAVLVGGIVATGIYWAIHHSTLRSPAETDAPAETTSSTGTKT